MNGAFQLDVSESLDRDGYVILPAVFLDAELGTIRAECAAALAAANGSTLATGGSVYGARNLLDVWPGAAALARAAYLAAGLQGVLGSAAGVVRGLYFDKPPGHSWALPWHRDRTIAVRAHRGAGVFGKPTTKAGVPHVEAPPAVLEGMLTMRVHLDAMTAENGPLRVMPGSHASELPVERPAVALECGAGDVLLMRPLLLHASGHSAAGVGHRRVVHLECAPSPSLTDGYEWHKYLPLVEPELLPET